MVCDAGKTFRILNPPQPRYSHRRCRWYNAVGGRDIQGQWVPLLYLLWKTLLPGSLKTPNTHPKMVTDQLQRVWIYHPLRWIKEQKQAQKFISSIEGQTPARNIYLEIPIIWQSSQLTKVEPCHYWQEKSHSQNKKLTKVRSQPKIK